MSDSNTMNHSEESVSDEWRRRWEVPEFAVKLWEGRRHRWCVVIPVINEGERILRLLERMRTEEIEQIADLVIVDGGSTDGSLGVPGLKQRSVVGLLEKTGPGKLSAQLRCAYAYAMDQGYDGVVTIDGNDKDDPAAIPQFVSALTEGIDFAQGSRFIPGGVAENTPPIRHLAIRGIHAPLLALSSGFRWTDTTQGFRAYSRRLLVDERIAPFRDIFSSYELLAYLSYRAPRLGLRCVELPTIRRYPPDEVPTKIAGWAGNWQLMKTLVEACRGRFDP